MFTTFPTKLWWHTVLGVCFFNYCHQFVGLSMVFMVSKFAWAQTLAEHVWNIWLGRQMVLPMKMFCEKWSSAQKPAESEQNCRVLQSSAQNAQLRVQSTFVEQGRLHTDWPQQHVFRISHFWSIPKPPISEPVHHPIPLDLPSECMSSSILQ